GGSCLPDGGGVTSRPTVTWGANAKGCQLARVGAGGCAAANLCAPRPGLPFMTRYCIAKSGDVACPGPPYDDARYVYYTGTDDQRDCTACGCGGLADAGCAGSIEVFTNVNCNGTPSSTVPAPTGCVSIGGGARALRLVTTSSGSCPTTGGAPTGGVSPTGPT